MTPYVLKLGRQRGSGDKVARILEYLSGTSRLMERSKEGIQQAEEALEIYEPAR